MAGNIRSIFLHGVRDGIPIALGYYAVAFSLGIIASRSGLDAMMGFFSSFFTRASAGEYSTYTLMAERVAYLEVVCMSVVVNIRYLLMGAALTQKFSATTPMYQRVLVGCCITDEVFGISIAYPGPLPPAYTYGASLISTIFWAAGTASGIIAGDVLPPVIVSSLSVALYGMFIAIIIPTAKRNKTVLAAIILSFVLSGLCAVMPYVSALSSGMRTVLLTIGISAALALIKPVDELQRPVAKHLKANEGGSVMH